MKFVCKTGIHKGQAFEIDSGVYRIGRASANNLQILNPYISKFHAEISVESGGKIWLDDLKSTNGTFIGKTRVTRKIALNHGDIVLLGKNEMYEVVIDERSAAGAHAAGGANEPATEFRAKPPTRRVEKSKRKSPESPVQPPSETPKKAGQSDSWFNLIDISSELGEKIDFDDNSIETGSFGDNDVDWPDVVKLKIAHDLYEKLLSGCKMLLQCEDEFKIFDRARAVTEPILAFSNGVLAFKRHLRMDESLEHHYLGNKDLELSVLADEMHEQNKGEANAQLLPYKNRFNSVLYKSLKFQSQLFGYMLILSDAFHAGFTKNDALAFEQICEIFEAALAKFIEKLSVMIIILIACMYTF